MKGRPRYAMTFALIALAAGMQSLAVAAATQPPAVAAAGKWIGLIDRQRWGESWTEAGHLFQSQVTRSRWTTMIKGARAPLGNVVARTLTSSTAATSLPGAPDGHYQVVLYKTRFVWKQAAVETVILDREKSGWKVAGNFLR